MQIAERQCRWRRATQWETHRSARNRARTPPPSGPPTNLAVQRTFWKTGTNPLEFSCRVTRSKNGIFSLFEVMPFFNPSVIWRNTFAGFPATIAFAGTSFVTTLPAPTMAFSPIVTFASMVEPDPIEAPFFTIVLSTFQSASVWSSATHCCARVQVIDEGHAMTDEYVVLDSHAFTDKRVTGNLAILPNDGILLNFDKRADFSVVANLASVEIDELGELDVLLRASRPGNAKVIVHSWTILLFLLEGDLGCFQHSHHPQTGLTVIEGSWSITMQSTKYSASALSASNGSSCGAHMSPER